MRYNDTLTYHSSRFRDRNIHMEVCNQSVITMKERKIVLGRVTLLMEL